jgi:uridine phosphorylase
VIDPSRFAIALDAHRAIVCFSNDCFATLAEALDLDTSAPRASGAEYGKRRKELVVYKASFGAPATGMLVEVLIASGVRQVIMLGMAGSLSPECRIGQVIIPTWGIREEGTSHHYFPAETGVGVSEGLARDLRSWLAHANIDYQEGGVWTTDAPFRETRDKVIGYAKCGVLAVEMECTALMAIAMYRGIDFAAVLLVTDELFPDTWHEDFRGITLRATRAAVCKALALGWGQGPRE